MLHRVQYIYSCTIDGVEEGSKCDGDDGGNGGVYLEAILLYDEI